MKKVTLTAISSNYLWWQPLFFALIAGIMSISNTTAQAAAPTDVPSLVASWGKHPVSQMKDPQQVAVDKSGNIYALDDDYQTNASGEKTQLLYKLDRQGNYLSKFPVKADASSIAVNTEGKVLLLHTSQSSVKLAIYAQDGSFLETKDLTTLLIPYLNSLTSYTTRPSTLLLDSKDNIYLSGRGLVFAGTQGYHNYVLYLVKLDNTASTVTQKWSEYKDYLDSFAFNFVDNEGTIHGVAHRGVSKNVSEKSYLVSVNKDNQANWISLPDFDDKNVISIAKHESSGQWYLGIKNNSIYVLDQNYASIGKLSEKIFHHTQSLTIIGNNLLINDISDHSPDLYQFDLNTKLMNTLATHKHASAKLDYPRTLMVNQQDNVFVFDSEQAGYAGYDDENALTNVGDYYGNYVAFKQYANGNYIANFKVNKASYDDIHSVANKPLSDSSLVFLKQQSDTSKIMKLTTAGKLTVIRKLPADIYCIECVISVDTNDNIYVFNDDNNKILKFSQNGTLLKSIPLSYPANSLSEMVVGSDASFYILNSNSLLKLNESGQVQWTVGYNFKTKTDAGGLALDSLNQIYVVDADKQRIQKFDSNGNFLAKWKTPEQPVAVAVGATDNDVYVSLQDGRVLHYQYK